MAVERVTRWYVEPRNSRTNEILADLLEHKGIADRDANPEVECHDGVRRALWECDHETIARLKRERDRQHLDFTVWTSEGNGKPREWGQDDRPIGASPKKKSAATPRA